MTNREKFAEQILDIACDGGSIAVNKVTSEPTACYKLECKDCLFNTHSYDYCGDKTEKWANSEYVEPPVDWSKVAVDTPILVMIATTTDGLKGILRNMRMEAFTLGIPEKHRGVVRDMQQRGN